KSTDVKMQFWTEVIGKLSFYTLLYAGLSGFFVSYYWTLHYFLVQRNAPFRSGHGSLLQLQPGLGFVPQNSFLDTLIHVRTNEPLSFHGLTDEMAAFLSAYLMHNIGGMKQECRNDEPFLHTHRTCEFDITAGGPCNLGDGFGFYRGEPCIILKLNRIIGWLPDPVPEFKEGVAVKCTGATGIDQELMGEPCYYDLQWWRRNRNNLTYVRSRSPAVCKKGNGIFDSMFYPYINQRQYHSPLVFVRFPFVKRYAIVNVVCFAIARNIQVNLAQGLGSVSFQLLID
ncbi:ATPase, Na K transporting, beta, partial [Cichlidogyrus casuarinus]